jgi:cytochrome c peroxidase
VRRWLLAGLPLIAAFVLASAAQTPSTSVWPAKDLRPPASTLNPSTPAKVELGRRLFYDGDLSFDGTMSCATCHVQRRGFADAVRTRPGVDGGAGRRNPQALANIGFFTSLTWGDHSVTSLEDQVKTPITGVHPVEMGMAGKEELLSARLRDQACYPRLFAAAFPDEGGVISLRTISLAIAAFEREIVSLDAPYDRARRGDGPALSEQQVRGEAVFVSHGCASCHAGPLFTDADRPDARAAFHNIGAGDGSDLGLAEITNDPTDRERFRTPSLRNATLSGPYLHDGSAATLEAAIRAHERPGPLRDAKLSSRSVSDAELADVVAFIGALTDETFMRDPRLSLPREGCDVGAVPASSHP